MKPITIITTNEHPPTMAESKIAVLSIGKLIPIARAMAATVAIPTDTIRNHPATLVMKSRIRMIVNLFMLLIILASHQ
jgi:hypothetical protein